MNLPLHRQDRETDADACPIYFDPETVITRNKKGNPLSRYRDDVWDYSASTRQKSKRLYHLTGFTGTTQSDKPTRGDSGQLATLVMAQAKALLWAYIRLSKKAPAFGTIYGINVTVKKWAIRAVSHGVSLFQILGDAELVLAKVDTENAGELSKTSVLLKALYKSRSVFGVSFDLDQVQKDLYRLRIDSPGSQQTPLIPSGIYSSILASLISRLGGIEANLDRLLSAFLASRKATTEIPDELSGSARGRHRKRSLESVFEFVRELGRESGDGTVHNFLCSKIVDCQTELIAICVAFTGMRLGEALHLPRDCLVAFEHDGKRHWFVRGFTYKLEDGETRETSWVTNEIGRRAISCAQKISEALGSTLGTASREVDYPLLFCGTESEFSRLGNRWKDKWAELAKNICPVVSEADMSELERMQLGRDWELTGIQIGLRWPMRAHQFRRALAVYAHRSGMVTLPSLKAQLQHITEEMSMYYSAGFQKAASLVFDSDHFSHEWNAAKAESSYFGYVLGLLLNDDELFGGAATWARSDKVRESSVSVHSREHGLELFRRGELAYRETPLGGCTSTEECNISPLVAIPYECLKTNCKNLVVFGKRLARVIESQEVVVAALAASEQGSVEHRLEADNLQTLVSARMKLKEVSANV
jgi:integrase